MDIYTFLEENNIPPLLFAMFFTATVETFLLWCFNYRRWKVLSYFFAINLISNLCVNTVYHSIFFFNLKNYLSNYAEHFDLANWISIFFLELLVILFEIILLRLAVKYDKKLLFAVSCTNLISFLLGTLLFGI